MSGFSKLHMACEARDPRRVLALLRDDATVVHARPARMSLRRVRFTPEPEGPTALELVTQEAAFPHEPSPVCAETAAILRNALSR